MDSAIQPEGDCEFIVESAAPTSPFKKNEQSQKAPPEQQNAILAFCTSILLKIKGKPGSSLGPRPIWQEVLMSFFTSFFAIAVLALISQYCLSQTEFTLLSVPFGASAVLVYAAPESPFAQPRNVIAGHILSAFVGVCWAQIFAQTELGQSLTWLPASLSVSTAIAVMQGTNTMHPPGGATALTAVIGTPKLLEIGFLYVLIPVAAASIIFVALALLLNNLSPRRRYPLYWLY